MTHIEKSLESMNVDKVRSNSIEAKDIITHRQKVIQLADSSELGWRVVKEYKKIPIASDSDNEKCMYKVEARASRKMKAEKSKRGTRGTSFPYRTRKQPEGSVSNVQTRIPEYRNPGLCFNCNQLTVK